MAKIRKLNYDDLNSIVGKFKNEAQEIDSMLKQTKGKVESLHNNQWVGLGSEKFFSEMDQSVLPAVGRLVQALNYAGETAQKIANTVRSFDEETKSFFNNLI
jgi:WXG100 family type VII secretion target